MAITISDVAREAGVSTSTVSKVLNHWSSISPETTRKVREVMERLHYTPNARAVSFARGSTKNILFLASFSKDAAYANPHMFDILCGVQSALSLESYSTTLACLPEGTGAEAFLSELISRRTADAIIIHGSAYMPSMSKILMAEQFPHMLIGSPGTNSRLCWIDTNNGLAGQIAAQHLIQHGYRKIAFIGGKSMDYISRHRLNGFLGAMYENGLRIPEAYTVFTDSSLQDGFEKSCTLLQLKNRPEAIICENNTLALGTMNAIEKAGLSIPSEIALLTFDIYPYSRIIEPEPTVVDIDVYDLGLQAASMILRKLENPSLLVQTYTTLPVVREGKTT
ncbi:MAG: LacI family DNA-binding transcriptional regulator [Lachnospiraceae bacterium]